METIAYALRTGIEYLLVPFDALPPTLALTLIALITGVIMLWVVGKTTPQARVERARNRMGAGIYEMRLYMDSPLRMFAAQGRMLGWSFLYVAYMLPAFVILTVPLGLLYLHLDARYGQAALPTNAPIAVRIVLASGADGYAVEPGELPEGLRVTAPPVFVEDESSVYLRLVIERPGTYELPIRRGEESVTKRISADPRALEVHPQRSSGADLWISEGDEAPVPARAGIREIRIDHPASSRTWIGLSWPWWLYWLLIATVAALALRKRLGVAL